jgi:2-polyprenyl-3-methyl-5-hydroxy-6-metoxy-1,4-benzoquinol methylase
MSSEVLPSFPATTTDPAYWEGQWRKARPRALSRWHPIYGVNGYIRRMVHRNVGPLRGKSVLEIGGAYSRILLSMAKWDGARATALDYARNALPGTEALFRSNGCEVETIASDMFHWQSGERKFDLVTHWGVLEHFGDPASVLRVCRHLVAPDGHVLFSMPNMRAWGARFWRTLSPRDWRLHIYHSDELVAEACKAAGLQLIRSFHFGIPMVKMPPFESTGALPNLLAATHMVLTMSAFLGLYHRGWRHISAQRGFLARPVL